MASEIERIAFNEAEINNIKGDIDRMRKHISDLLTFKSHIEGGLKILHILVGLGLIGQVLMMIKMFVR